MSGYNHYGYSQPYASADPYADPSQQQHYYQQQQNQYPSNNAHYYGRTDQQQGWHDQEQAGLDASMANMSISGGQHSSHDQYQQSASAAYPDQWYDQGSERSSEIVPCDPRFLSVSVSAFPSTPAMRLGSSLPITLSTQPLAEVYVDPAYMNPDERGSLPCVNFGSAGVVRCKACRAYINPYCKFLNGGSQWRCSVCARPNDVQNDYFCDLDARGERKDKAQRIELSLASFEIVAPAEYMVRPPQPPAFLFAIDVSKRSAETGVINVVCDTILSLLDYFPGLPRTKIGFITYDSAVHLYSLRSGLSRPQMMVLPNLEDLFLPQPEDYLVDLEESRPLLKTLLESLPAMHANTRNVECALGAATMAAFRIINAIGGKLVFFSTSLPSFGPARLKNRDGPSANQAELQQPATDFYKSWAHKCTRMQVRADVFLFPDQYCDIASISQLTQNTGGQLYTFPSFDQYRSGDQLRADLTRCITRDQAWEAVLRIRISKGAKIVGYHGNYCLRGTDLLSVPNCSADDAFLVELAHDDTNPQGAVAIQVALLYTASFGERRIRVHNHLLPVIDKIEDIFYFVDLASLINGVAKKALAVCLSSSMDKSREFIQNTCISILSAYRKSTSSFQPIQLNSEQDYPDTLRYLPMMTLALLKCTAFKDSPLVSADMRTIHLTVIRSMSCQALDLYLRPRIYRIDSLAGQEGLYDDSGMVTLPTEINATSAEMFDDGAFLIDNGMVLFIWLGRSLSSHILQTWFGIPSLQGLDPETLQLLLHPEHGPESALSRLHNIISFLRSQGSICQRIQVIRQPTSDKISVIYEEFLSSLILDRTATVMSYNGFLSHITKSTG